MLSLRKAVRASTLVVAVLGSAVSAPAQVKLGFKFPENKDFSYVETVKVDQTLTLAGQEVPTKSEQSVRSRSSVGAKRDDGSIPVKRTIEALKVQLDLPMGINLTIDTEDKGDPPAGELPQLKPIRDVIKALAGATYTVVMDPSGKVAAVEGAEQAVKVDDLDQMVADQIKKRFDADRLKRETAEEYGVFPDSLLRKGEPWDRTETQDLGGGQTLTYQKQYEYQGTVDQGGKALDKISVKVNTVSYAMEPNPGFPLTVDKSDLKIDSSDGSILFDRELGQIVSNHLKMRIVGDMTFTANGQNVPAKLDLTMETDSELKGSGN